MDVSGPDDNERWLKTAELEQEDLENLSRVIRMFGLI